MKPSCKLLIDYWIEIGKVREADGAYYFQHEMVGDLKLSVSWEMFFRMFSHVNHTCFLKELEGEAVENPFDPWRNPTFVGISIRIPPMNRQDYQLVEVIDIG